MEGREGGEANGVADQNLSLTKVVFIRKFRLKWFYAINSSAVLLAGKICGWISTVLNGLKWVHDAYQLLFGRFGAFQVIFPGTKVTILKIFSPQKIEKIDIYSSKYIL
jgi:hypothetical protein